MANEQSRASETFARRLHHRYAPVELTSARAYGFSAPYIVNYTDIPHGGWWMPHSKLTLLAAKTTRLSQRSDFKGCLRKLHKIACYWFCHVGHFLLTQNTELRSLCKATG